MRFLADMGVSPATVAALRDRDSPSVVVFRLRDETPASVTPKLLAVVGECAAALASGAVVVVEDSRYRLRPLPIRTP